jgi:uncharacterized membrane protein
MAEYHAGAGFVVWRGATQIAPHPYCLANASLLRRSRGRAQLRVPVARIDSSAPGAGPLLERSAGRTLRFNDRASESSMRSWLTEITEYAVLVIDAMALVIVLVGSVTAFIAAVRHFWRPLAGHERREIWLHYARWLVAGLTFQLAADIIESSIATSWESVARLAAIAVIRTFLNYFRERDVAELRERQHEPTMEGSAAK